MKKYKKIGNVKILLKNPKGLDELDIKWNLMFNQLLKFKAEHGHCNVPQQKPDNPMMPELTKLGSWCCTQRRNLKKGTLLIHRQNKLVEAGFVFDPNETKWENFFKQLVEYKSFHGHCNVPQNKKNHDPLARWVNKQRDHRNTMPPDKKKRLLEIGFVFEVMNTWWEEYFAELLEYKKRFGNTNVSEYNDEYYILAKWVSRMRASKLAGNRKYLTEEQEKRLEEIGFIWQPELERWNMHYADLLKFYEEFGHCKVPYNYDKIKGLQDWLQRQRNRKTPLSKEQIQKLKKLGIKWSK